MIPRRHITHVGFALDNGRPPWHPTGRLRSPERRPGSEREPYHTRPWPSAGGGNPPRRRLSGSRSTAIPSERPRDRQRPLSYHSWRPLAQAGGDGDEGRCADRQAPGRHRARWRRWPRIVDQADRPSRPPRNPRHPILTQKPPVQPGVKSAITKARTTSQPPVFFPPVTVFLAPPVVSSLACTSRQYSLFKK